MQIADASQFQPRMTFAYPSHQKGPRMEEYAFLWMSNHTDLLSDDYVYVPVFWDNYHVTHNFGRQGIAELQEYCDKLSITYRGKKIFTVVEYADGTLINSNIVSFACGGKGDIPIPLLCDAHPFNHQDNTQFYATFTGNLSTHIVRQKLIDIYGAKPGWHIGPSEGISRFRFLMDNSKYALCPRGYGPTSYRLFEAIQMGCIPVYIGDDFWLPYKDISEFDWNSFSVLVNIKNIQSLGDILAEEDLIYRKKMEVLHEIQYKFTHEQVMFYIIKKIGVYENILHYTSF